MRSRLNSLKGWMVLALTALSAIVAVIGGISTMSFGMAHVGLQTLAHTLSQLVPGPGLKG